MTEKIKVIRESDKTKDINFLLKNSIITEKWKQAFAFLMFLHHENKEKSLNFILTYVQDWKKGKHVPSSVRVEENIKIENPLFLKNHHDYDRNLKSYIYLTRILTLEFPSFCSQEKKDVMMIEERENTNDEEYRQYCSLEDKSI